MSDGCTTCYDLAPHVSAFVRPGLSIILVARSAEAGHKWTTRYGVEGSEDVTIDDGSLVDHLGVKVMPSVVRFEGEYPVSAATVPSERQLAKVVDWLSGDVELHRETTTQVPEIVGKEL